MRISEPARRHRVSDEDIEHAVRHAIRQVEPDDDFTLLIGPAATGALLEIGVLDLEGDDPVVIHAMPARPQFLQ